MMCWSSGKIGWKEEGFVSLMLVEVLVVSSSLTRHPQFGAFESGGDCAFVDVFTE